MKPCAFQLYTPSRLEDALEALWELTEEGLSVKVLAGGQSLMPVLNMRLATPDVLIDLNGLENDLNFIIPDANHIRIGALTRHHQLETSPLISRDVPIIAEAERLIGHVAIRSRGTIGGSLAHADPSAELPLVATLLDASMTLQSKNTTRTIPATEFFLAYLMTNLESTEILTEITIPALPIRSGQSIQEFALRHGDFAIAVAGAQVTVDETGCIADARLALGGVGPIPLDMGAGLAQLVGTRPLPQDIKGLMNTICRNLEPDGDIHADSAYRKDLAVTLSTRALVIALQKSQNT